MLRKLTSVFAAAVVVALAGCAHPIVISPDIGAIGAPSAPLIQKGVGYYISAENRALEVTTPGGGGDKIRYFPYRDLETGLYKVLASNFSSVVRLELMPNSEALKAQGISYLITPRISTTSSSDGLFTWPPTAFEVELDCKIIGPGATEVAAIKVVGKGAATFSEFKSDFPLAAKRASTDALNKLHSEIGKHEALRR